MCCQHQISTVGIKKSGKTCKSPKTPIILLSQKIQRIIAYYKNYIDKKTYGREGITG